MTNTQVLITTSIAIYIVSVIVIGLPYVKKSQSSENRFIRGQNLGTWVAANGAEATNMRGWPTSLTWPSVIASLGGVSAIYELLPACKT